MKRIAAVISPDGKSVVQGDWKESKKNYAELKRILQKLMCFMGKGELSKELQSWITEKEKTYIPVLSDIIRKGNNKARNLYYGMVYAILQDNGFYMSGKNGGPICITSNNFCNLFQLCRPTMDSTYFKLIFNQEQLSQQENKDQEWMRTFHIEELFEIYLQLEQEIIHR